MREDDLAGAVSVIMSCVEELADSEDIEGAIYTWREHAYNKIIEHSENIE